MSEEQWNEETEKLAYQAQNEIYEQSSRIQFERAKIENMLIMTTITYLFENPQCAKSQAAFYDLFNIVHRGIRFGVYCIDKKKKQ
jgi:hypothetical protein